MANCTVPDIPDKNTTGDTLYGGRICDQIFVDWAWPAYKFNSEYWKHGFGFDDVCNTDLPAARMLSAIWLLNYSAEDYMNEDWNSSCLQWACRYVREQVGDLRSMCGDGTYIAYTTGGHIELYLGCFYSKDVPGRAETLMHESRHQGGKPHDANFPSWSGFGAGKSGADSTWDYEGAWMYGALYLWWFYAEGTRTTPAIRELARQRAQYVIDNAFATHPGYVI
jgi:hypothetical protein